LNANSRCCSLFLADNPLDAVYNCAETAELTARLKSLSLSNTRINSWESIESLDTMEQLEELRVAHIPLMEGVASIENCIKLVLIICRIFTGGAASSGYASEIAKI